MYVQEIIDFVQKQNGNLQYVPEQQANAPVETTFVQQVLPGMITPVNHRKCGLKAQINGDCLICMEISGSGFQIITVIFITLKLRMTC